MDLITYEAIFDMVRKEKATEELLVLNPNIYSQISFYLKTKLQIYNQAKEKNLSETQKIEAQLTSARSLTKELYDRRERKIVQLAINISKTHSDKVDLNGLLENEKKIFEELVVIFDKYRKDVLLEAVNARTPIIEEGVQSSVGIDESEHSSQDKTSKIREDSSNKIHDEKTNIEPKLDIPKKSEYVAEEILMVKFLRDVPKFYGPNLEIYGPFKPGDIANLPKIIADILLHKKVAE